MLKVSRRFFALPEKHKLVTEMVNSRYFRGYNRAGFEHTRGKPDWREQVDIGPERPALPFDREAQGPNQSPPRAPPQSIAPITMLDAISARANGTTCRRSPCPHRCRTSSSAC